MDPDRRSFLGGAAVALLGGWAGCLHTGSPSPSPVANEPDYGGWFARSDGYSHTLDFTGRGQVNVKVGVPGNGGHFAFGPPAVAVSPHAKVVWEWTGLGGQHDVVAADGSFRSPYHDSKGATFSHVFAGKGIHRYYCDAHRSQGMRGAVVVVSH